MLPSAGSQYKGIKGPAELSGAIAKGTEKVVEGVKKAKTAQDAYKTGKYRQLRKGAEKYVAAVGAQRVKESLRTSAQTFSKNEGEKQFDFEKKPVPKGVRTTQEANVESKSILDSGARTTAGNLSVKKTGKRRVTATSRELPTAGTSLSSAQRLAYGKVQNNTPRRVTAAQGTPPPAKGKKK